MWSIFAPASLKMYWVSTEGGQTNEFIITFGE